ncbi:MAG: ATP-binding protein, partial [Candidatus Zapsychrus exili]|nr:ATP-binding protein [Candidatus Zapsychrus exili]
NIKKKSNDPTLKDNIKSIERKLLDSEAIIDSLLKYARIKAPAFEKERIYEILNDCVETTEKRFRKRKDIISRYYSSLKNVLAEVDQLQIKQIFTNLLCNSYQSLKGKKGTISVEGSLIKGQTIEVKIKDNGSGIPSQFLNKVFDPFFTRKSGGTGLGLAVCKQLIELHRGEIQIDSQQGKGATVTVKLPIKSKK